MKFKLFLISSFFFLTGIFSSAAQTDTRVGAVLSYGTEIENLGIGVNAEFPVADRLTIQPSFIYYLPKDQGFGDLNWWALNANANYYLLESDAMGLYGLAGLNYSHLSWDGEFMGVTTDASDGEFGLNLGLGANFDIGSSITPFAQLKYVIIDSSQLVIGAGVRFNL